MVHPGLQHSDSYWPPGAPNQSTLAAFVEMYTGQGFAACESADMEAGAVKVAIYVEPTEGLVEHAAVQLPNGRWASKMGENEDIMHTLEGLEGPPHYFRVAQILKCRLENAPRALQQWLAAFVT